MSIITNVMKLSGLWLGQSAGSPYCMNHPCDKEVFVHLDVAALPRPVGSLNLEGSFNGPKIATSSCLWRY